MERNLTIISLAIFFALTLTSCADESPKKEDKQTVDIEALIEKLAKRHTTRLANSEMMGAWIKLRDLGPDAFPTVIEHFDDERESFTTDSGSTDETWTVSRACFDVVRCNLEPYNFVVYSSSIPDEEFWWRPNYCREFLNTPEKAKEWIAAREKKSLVDLQIEVLEWVTTNRSKRKAEISIEDRDHLRKVLEVLKNDRKPLEPCIPWAK